MDKDRRRERFKELIRMIESSGNTNTNHPIIPSGIHEGDSAIGQYALMPNTVDYILNAEERDTGSKSPYDHLKALSSQQLKKSLDVDKNIPDSLKKTEEGAEEYLANRYSDIILNKHPDLVNAQAAWNLGHNVSEENIKKQELESEVMAARAKKAKDFLLQDSSISKKKRTPQSIYIPNIKDLLSIK